MRSGSLAVLASSLLLAALLAGCSGGSGSDRDKDGLLDDEETAGWDVTVTDQAGATTTYHVTSDPGKADTSGGGLTDVYKRVFGLDPRKVDTDGDGLTDCQEIRLKSLVGCQDPLDTTSDSGYRTRADKWDTDGDGLGDGDEVLRLHTDPLALDTDHDGLSDGQEVRFHADPTKADTDGDGCKDGVDALPAMKQAFQPGLQGVRLPSGPVHLKLILSDAAVRAPATGEWQATGADQDAAGLEPPAVPPGSCGASPDFPWVAVDLVAQRADGSGIDITSKSNPDGAPRVWWNLGNQTFAWKPGGAPLPTPLVWTGSDGDVRFLPKVVAAS